MVAQRTHGRDDGAGGAAVPSSRLLTFSLALLAAGIAGFAALLVG